VVERYALLDREDVNDTLERGAKENWRPAGPVNPNYKDKYLQIGFTIDDAGAYTTPWTASMVYLRDHLEWPEIACAENTFGFHHTDLPHAERTDF
jgi:hypothetical protein